MYADPNSPYMSQKEKEALKIGYIPCERADINKAHSPYKYGCNYCAYAHLITKKDGVYKAVNINNAVNEDTQGTRLYCPHKECPYKEELDKYRSYADYDLYPEQTKDRAYGFTSRGCPRGCDFCHVKAKEGACSHKVADISEFWRGQKYIEILDPNLLACPEAEEILQQIIDTGATVNFNQGLDIRLMTKRKAELLAKIKVETIHFAYDRPEDREIIEPKFLQFRDVSTVNYRNLRVYVLCGDRERRVRDEDLHRINWLRQNGYNPYVMLYDKEHLPKQHELKRLQRWVNNKFVFWSVPTFEEYKRKGET